MGWLTIVMAIIQAIPTVIKVIQMIRDLLKERSPAERKAYAGEMKGVLKRWREHRDSKRAAGEFEGILGRIRDGR